MSVTGPGSITALNLTAQTNMFSQLTTLSQELGTGQAAQTYSGLGSQAGVAVELGAQVSAINGYSATATNVSTTLSIAQSVLGQLSQAGAAVAQSISQQGAFTLNGNGQTTTQQAAAGYLGQILDLLNTQVGGNYLFSGSAVNQPAVASANDILNGNGAQQGLTQTIAQRLQADQGAGNNGRLTVGGTSPAVTLSSDGSPFGFQLAGVNSSLTGATASGPTGSPPTITHQSRFESQCRRYDFVCADAARWIQPNRQPSGNHSFAAGRQPVHYRGGSDGDRRQPADRVEHRHRQSCADRAAGRVRHRRVQ